MSQSIDKLRAPRPPASLASMQLDVTSRLGALTSATPTGFATLDAWSLGGLRIGSMFSVAAAPGCGKTAFLVLLSYMAARARAAVLFASAALDETEFLARIAAQVLHREYPDAQTTYGSIGSGDASRDQVTRAAVGTSVDLAIGKVGQLLHFHRFKPFDTTLDIGAQVAHLWGRHERVILFIDGVEALAASGGGDTTRAALANAELGNRLTQVGYELRQLADGGCAVVVTSELEHSNWLLLASTLAAELRPAQRPLEALTPRDRVLGAEGVDLIVTKNHIGRSGTIPLKFIAGGAVFEEVDIQGVQ